MLCFLSELLQHPREAQAEREQDTLPFPVERNAAAEDLHIKFLRCCQRKNSSIPRACLLPSIAVKLSHDQAQAENWLQGRCGGTQFCSPPITGDAQLLWWLLTWSAASQGNPWRKCSSRAIAYGDAMERSGSDKMTLRVWHCRLPQNHIKMTHSYQI